MLCFFFWWGNDQINPLNWRMMFGAFRHHGWNLTRKTNRVTVILCTYRRSSELRVIYRRTPMSSNYSRSSSISKGRTPPRSRDSGEGLFSIPSTKSSIVTGNYRLGSLIPGRTVPFRWGKYGPNSGGFGRSGMHRRTCSRWFAACWGRILWWMAPVDGWIARSRCRSPFWTSNGWYSRIWLARPSGISLLFPGIAITWRRCEGDWCSETCEGTYSSAVRVIAFGAVLLGHFVSGLLYCSFLKPFIF